MGRTYYQVYSPTMYDLIPKLHKTSDGGFIFVFGYFSPFGLFIKVNGDGYIQWHSDLYLSAVDVAESGNGEVVVAGNGPLFGEIENNTSDPQIGILTTDSLGVTLLWCGNSGWGFAISYTQSFQNISPTTSSAGTMRHIQISLSDLPLWNLDGCVYAYGKINEAIPDDDPIKIYPNPCSGPVTITIEAGGTDEIRSIVIYNPMGEKVWWAFENRGSHVTFDLSGFSDGIYIAKMIIGQTTYYRKIVISH